MTTPAVVTRPIWLAPGSVNHKLPPGTDTIPDAIPAGSALESVERELVDRRQQGPSFERLQPSRHAAGNAEACAIHAGQEVRSDQRAISRATWANLMACLHLENEPIPAQIVRMVVDGLSPGRDGRARGGGRGESVEPTAEGSGHKAESSSSSAHRFILIISSFLRLAGLLLTILYRKNKTRVRNRTNGDSFGTFEGIVGVGAMFLDQLEFGPWFRVKSRTHQMRYYVWKRKKRSVRAWRS